MVHSPSEEQKAAMAAGKEAARVRHRIIGYPLGATVKVTDRTRWNGSTGVVFAHNSGDQPEVGVKVGSTEIWCYPSQLTVIA